MINKERSIILIVYVKVASTYVTGFETYIGIVTWSAIFPRSTSAFFNPFLFPFFTTQHVRVKPRHSKLFKSNKSFRRTSQQLWRTYTFFQIPPPKDYWKCKWLISLGQWLFLVLTMTQYTAWQQVLESKPNPCYVGWWRSCWSERVRRGISTTHQKCTWTYARSSHGRWYC